MHLSDHDLRQLDEAYLDGLTPEQARALLSRALADLKAARERLNQNPSNSSRPPSSRLPWAARETGETPASDPATPDAAAVPESDATAGERPKVSAKAPPASDRASTPPRRPGRRPGAPGHSRTQRLNIDAERTHAPSCCRGCGKPLSPAAPSRAHNARYEIDLIQPGAGSTGLVLRQTKHTYLECRCVCGHVTQAEPGRAEDEAEWTVALTEWHLAGPTLVVFICFLTQRMRLSRARVREFLLDWLGLELSTATIRNIDLLHADETSWKQHGQLLWLWVFTCAQATLFVVGKCSVEVVREVRMFNPPAFPIKTFMPFSCRASAP